MSLAPVPSLDELAADPWKAISLPPAVAAELLVRVAALQTTLLVRALAAPANGNAPTEAGEDRLLDVEETARTLGVSEDWLYRRAAKLPFTVRLGRTLRFSARGIERYIRQRQGR